MATGALPDPLQTGVLMSSISQDFTAKNAGKIAETIAARGAVYAPPEVNFSQIAEFWRMWMRWRYKIDVPLTAADVGMMQAGIKMSRLCETPTHEDSSLDMAAYVLLGGGCAQSDGANAKEA
jgi:hypothetical protein